MQCGKKNLLYWALEARYFTAYNQLKSAVRAHVHKTTYRPQIDTALHVMLLDAGKSITWACVGGGWALEILICA